MVQARAEVATDKPERYGKQLASHLGRRCGVADEDGGVRITLPVESGAGSCLLAYRPGVLELRAEAEDAEVLDRVRDVVGRHLERFGQRDSLVVRWQPM
ncbi:hypothetical protein A8924_1697 [Saccharopolyspora erythraea NRRL 2338]|uniref:Uncharacterized protein n=2 Tax=Saccharopolyspora erythraea TaxID=1836 RepID=A4F999_SACEN|nr:DUF2218 domain-containing protein [Saccharopolyspora erythraea]EQD86571.1 hypothetical protein N599_08890 [Saccharopolyspora erythraea D]PFG94416.1 hypothetical protein A8924_1697 [Saccharopolyspora erythraea NRRL 2338]QRK91176.1 DUF2218 domain-containing protein [Saccharopolyspora erythraea]CAM00624.1 hypothetical protein SACE_1301 [Saccharopolyspora erythraea NRRL 2338]